MVAAFTFISPVTSSIGAPAGAAIARDFGIHNESLVAMTVSIFVLAYGEHIYCTVISLHSSLMIILYSFWPSDSRTSVRGIRTISCHDGKQCYIPRYVLRIAIQ